MNVLKTGAVGGAAIAGYLASRALIDDSAVAGTLGGASSAALALAGMEYLKDPEHKKREYTPSSVTKGGLTSAAILGGGAAGIAGGRGLIKFTNNLTANKVKGMPKLTALAQSFIPTDPKKTFLKMNVRKTGKAGILTAATLAAGLLAGWGANTIEDNF